MPNRLVSVKQPVGSGWLRPRRGMVDSNCPSPQFVRTFGRLGQYTTEHPNAASRSEVWPSVTDRSATRS
jgi:hypothetical protein